jgi:glucose-6-phosphate 1-dehydrogenase
MTGAQADLAADDRKAPPSALVIFGASGDLTRRKLVPGLANLARHKRLPDEFAVVGVGRSDFDDEAFRQHMSDAAALPPRLVEQFRFVRGGYDDPQTYRALAEVLGELDVEAGDVGDAADGRLACECGVGPVVVVPV